MFQSKKDTVYVILAGIFITNAVVAELIGGKLIHVGSAVMSIGILPWPIVFVTTDLINEYFGEKGVRKLSLITASLIAYTFVVLYLAMQIPAVKGSNLVTDVQFNGVFGQSMWIIVGSITAFMVSQIIDVTIFHFVKNKTGNKTRNRHQVKKQKGRTLHPYILNDISNCIGNTTQYSYPHLPFVPQQSSTTNSKARFRFRLNLNLTQSVTIHTRHNNPSYV